MGYIPIDYEVKIKKSSDQVLAKSITHLYQSFLVLDYAYHDGLGDGICNLFKEIDAVIKEKIELPGIRDVELGEQLQNWTSTPTLIPLSSWSKDSFYAYFEN